MNFLTGVITGIVISTIGVAGVARYVDHGVNFVKQEAIRLNAEPSK